MITTMRETGNDMEVINIIIAILFLYFIARLLVQLTISIIDICVTSRRDRMSIKNRKVIRRWEWLRKTGCHETAEMFILSKLK